MLEEQFVTGLQITLAYLLFWYEREYALVSSARAIVPGILQNVTLWFYKTHQVIPLSPFGINCTTMNYISVHCAMHYIS